MVDLFVLLGLIRLMILLVFIWKLMLFMVIRLLNFLCVECMLRISLLVCGFLCCLSVGVLLGVWVVGVEGNSLWMNGYMLLCVYCSNSISSMLNIMILKLLLELSSFGRMFCRLFFRMVSKFVLSIVFYMWFMLLIIVMNRYLIL